MITMSKSHEIETGRGAEGPTERFYPGPADLRGAEDDPVRFFLFSAKDRAVYRLEAAAA